MIYSVIDKINSRSLKNNGIYATLGEAIFLALLDIFGVTGLYQFYCINPEDDVEGDVRLRH